MALTIRLCQNPLNSSLSKCPIKIQTIEFYKLKYHRSITDTYVSDDKSTSWYCRAYVMYIGIHQANAPATKATHVKPRVEKTKLLLQKSTQINRLFKMNPEARDINILNR